ncbi:Alpha/Beta hydrolase protein [Macrophomina phaseolina]|uniref:Alpha/Beta hydrolase protein n=1 Tax=Macrophomina phaseolina TaxID=35725 RepID=A0ABQ8FP89_9PEZI|nr:Alpha/Beta hydrolase protein [Macrophomina phaseolina]
MLYHRESYHYDAGVLGHIEGLTVTANGKPALRYFGGLPYALPPIGPYRFRAPRKLPPYYRYGTAANPGRFTGGAGICPQPRNRNPPDPSLFDEDCLQLNIWIPTGDVPKGGWPVLFYIHGGYLQWGTPNWSPEALAPLLSDSAFEGIVVMPSYRLNALGFLAGKELADEASNDGQPVGNMGFWDQRTALEWAHENISRFAGSPGNITIGGYSAGALSAFQQLAHELYHIPEADAIIKRLFMFSNSPGVQPKTLQEHQKQFDEYITRLGIPWDLTDEAKFERLRAIPYRKLIEIQSEMTISEFRALSDGVFYPRDLIHDINNGDFAKRMKSRNITLLNGECRDEHTMYRNWRTPENSYSSVYTRLCAEYPEKVSLALLQHYCGSPQSLPSCCANWQELFGRIYADVQVHHLERGFHNALFKGGLQPGKDILRYRFDRRLKCVDDTVPVEWGVTHSTDVPIWFWGTDYSGGMTHEEKTWLKGWNEGFAAFVKGEAVDWGTRTSREMRRWRSDGETDIWEDDMWEKGLKVWNIVNGDGERACT